MSLQKKKKIINGLKKGLAQKRFLQKANQNGKSNKTRPQPAAKIKEVIEGNLSNGLSHFRRLTATKG